MEKEYLALQKELRAQVFCPDLETNMLSKESSIGQRLIEYFDGSSSVIYSFLSHFEETLNAALQINHKEAVPKHIENYGTYLLKLTVHYKDLRACFVLFKNGYPLQGFALLRDILDRSLEFTCVANKLLTLYEVDGLEKDSKIEGAKDFSARMDKAQEAKAYKKLFSSIPQESQSKLKFIKDMFHYQTHKSMFSQVELAKQLKSTGHYSISPIFDTHSAALFANRYAEIAWITHRLLTLCQLKAGQFGKKFNSDWKLLDKNFSCLSSTLVSFSGEKIGEHFTNFINARLDFNPENSFYAE